MLGVGVDLAEVASTLRGWCVGPSRRRHWSEVDQLKAITTDNGGEFRAQPFTRSVAQLGAKQRFIRRRLEAKPLPGPWCLATQKALVT